MIYCSLVNDSVVAFINIDSMPGTKAIPFRSTTSEIITYVSSMKYPFATAVTSDIYNLKLIHSDTDFTALSGRYKDMDPDALANGSFPVGMDFSFFEYPQRYHTITDDLSNYADGSLQFTGDNVLSVLKAMQADTDIADDIQETLTTRYTFYSVMGLFVVVYPLYVHCILHLVVTLALGVLIYLYLRKLTLTWKSAPSHRPEANPIKLTLKQLAAFSLSLLAGIVLCLICSLILEINSVFYYSSPLLAITVFTVPTICGISAVMFVHYRRKCRPAEEKYISPQEYYNTALAAICIIWFTIMVITSPLSFFVLK